MISENVKHLCAIEIPVSVEVLCDECFGEAGLSRVKFVRIEKGAFWMCKSLQEIEIPASVSRGDNTDVQVKVKRELNSALFRNCPNERGYAISLGPNASIVICVALLRILGPGSRDPCL